jgi:hypothetical protein
MVFDWKNLLCKIGLHDWSEPHITYLSGSNVRDMEKHCKHCGRRKRWIETA